MERCIISGKQKGVARMDNKHYQIDKNRDFSISYANHADLSEEDRYNYRCMAERDARVKAKVTKYTDSQGYARLYRSEYQDIFHILLENSVARK